MRSDWNLAMMESHVGQSSWSHKLAKNTSLNFHPVFLVKVLAASDGPGLAGPGLDGPAGLDGSAAVGDGGDGKPAMGWALGLPSMAVGEDGAGKSLAGGGGCSEPVGSLLPSMRLGGCILASHFGFCFITW